jgi:hypothetical protein
VTRRYYSGLLNFAAHSPEIATTRQRIPFCAPPADRAEGTVPVRIGGSACAVRGYARASADQGPPTRDPALPHNHAAAITANILICRVQDAHPRSQRGSATGPREGGHDSPASLPRLAMERAAVHGGSFRLLRTPSPYMLRVPTDRGALSNHAQRARGIGFRVLFVPN